MDAGRVAQDAWRAQDVWRTQDAWRPQERRFPRGPSGCCSDAASQSGTFRVFEEVVILPCTRGRSGAPARLRRARSLASAGSDLTSWPQDR